MRRRACERCAKMALLLLTLDEAMLGVVEWVKEDEAGVLVVDKCVDNGSEVGKQRLGDREAMRAVEQGRSEVRTILPTRPAIEVRSTSMAAAHSRLRIRQSLSSLRSDTRCKAQQMPECSEK